MAVYLQELADGFVAERVIAAWIGGRHPGRSLRRGEGGVSTRTKARGTAMTGVGCSAPTLATLAVERPLLYDALMLVDEQTNAGPSGRGASLGASGVSHGMSVPHTVSGGGTVDLPGSVDARAASRRIRTSATRAPTALVKSRGRLLPLVPAVPAARFPQPHSASSSWASIIGNDPCTTRESCDGQRGLDDHEGMNYAPGIHLSEALDLSEQPGPLHIPTRVRHRRVEN